MAAARRELATIGVYGFTAEGFLAALRAHDARLLVDVRQRRGVRGPEYAWANSQRLQAAMAAARIAYRHHPELAPTTELRQLQYQADARMGVGKRSRVELSAAYRERYTREILDRVDLMAFLASLPGDGLAVLLCVERDPAACHRSLIARRIDERFALAVSHIVPADDGGGA